MTGRQVTEPLGNRNLGNNLGNEQIGIQATMSLLPTKLEMTAEDHLQIEWNDGHLREYTPSELRDACPCATCREKRKEGEKEVPLLNVLQPGEATPTKITNVEPIGRYAYGIHFGDGHDTGIYEFERLYRLGRQVS